MVKTVDLNTKFLKKVDNFIKKNLERENLGAYELFFTIVADLLKKDMVLPFESFKDFIEKEEILTESLELYTQFYNAIIAKLQEIAKEETEIDFIDNMFNLIKDELSNKSFSDMKKERIKILFIFLFLPLNSFISSFFEKNQNDSVKEIEQFLLKNSEGFDEEEIEFLIEDILELLFFTELVLQNDKKSIEKLQKFYDTPQEFLQDMIDLSITTYAKLNEIRKNANKEETGVDIFEFENSEKKIDYSKVGRNDPCPCGSGKKYKKCCLNKKNNYYL